MLGDVKLDLCKVGDSVILNNFRRGIIECPIIYVSDYFVIVKSKFYNMTINVTDKKKFNNYINDMNEFVGLVKRGE